ncbi:MAG: GTP cyclohydrolase I FolE2 [Pseudobdellovibrionaceae bacterium]|nr:MAG: GTP cyclohydrolase I FolE2 [Pseudobdellovibrionaceae bacterium]
MKTTHPYMKQMDDNPQGISCPLPDVSHEELPLVGGELERVGMAGIEMPILVSDPSGSISRIPANITAFVSLNQPDAKGIHMSRLYLRLQEIVEEEVFSLKAVKHLLEEFVRVQGGLSNNSFLNVEYTLPVKRPALKSQESGWRQYPVFMGGELTQKGVRLHLGGRVTYSSTCPCSAALARQLIQDQFKKDFGASKQVTAEAVMEWLGQESSIVATPHAQRSWADFKVGLTEQAWNSSPVQFIDDLEKVLVTAVQAAVKRQDEQEFALLNGRNLMFCEDAARRIKKYFTQDSRVQSYWARVDHSESLHPHSAVSEISGEK